MTCCLRLLFFVLALFAAGAFAQQPPPKQRPKNNIQVTHHADWAVRCPKSNQAHQRCEMTQLVKNPQNGKPVMRVLMGYPPQVKTAAMIFIVPLGTRLAPGMELSVDGDKPRRFPFQICLDQGCRADYPVNNKLLQKLKGGHEATASIIDPHGKELDLKFSLQGFTASNNQIAPH